MLIEIDPSFLYSNSIKKKIHTNKTFFFLFPLYVKSIFLYHIISIVIQRVLIILHKNAIHVYKHIYYLSTLFRTGSNNTLGSGTHYDESNVQSNSKVIFQHLPM